MFQVSGFTINEDCKAIGFWYVLIVCSLPLVIEQARQTPPHNIVTLKPSGFRDWNGPAYSKSQHSADTGVADGDLGWLHCQTATVCCSQLLDVLPCHSRNIIVLW